jgi:hypothetical protein
MKCYHYSHIQGTLGQLPIWGKGWVRKAEEEEEHGHRYTKIIWRKILEIKSFYTVSNMERKTYKS